MEAEGVSGWSCLVCHAVDLKDQVVGAQTKFDILTEAVGVLLFNELKDFSLEGMEPHPVTTEQAVFSTGSFSKNIAVAVRKETLGVQNTGR